MPLNINFQQILLHLLNFVVLFGVLYFLLYKPVKDFMDKRVQHFEELESEANENVRSAAEKEQEYQKLLDNADEEITLEKHKARKEIERITAEKIKEAEEEAAKILADARENISREHDKRMKEAQNEIADMIATATEKLIVNSSTSDAYDQFLDAAKRGTDKND